MNNIEVTSKINTPQYITIEYTFTNQDGDLLGSSLQSGLFTFGVGEGDAIPGLEEHIVGNPVGTVLQFIIPATKAYGIHNPSLVQTIEQSVLPESLSVSVGQSITINNTRVTITEITDTSITLDRNHPLAGIDLHFSAKITDISDTRKDAHGCGCGNACSCSS